MPGRYTEVAFIQGWPLRGVPLQWVIFVGINFRRKTFRKVSQILAFCKHAHACGINICGTPEAEVGYKP